jgi:hypothetical protein
MQDLRILLLCSYTRMNFRLEAKGDPEAEDTETEGDLDMRVVETFREGPSLDNHIQKLEENSIVQMLIL